MTGRHVRAQTPAFFSQARPAPASSRDRRDVDVIIPVKDPDLEWLHLTLGALEQQTHRPRVTVVDCLDPQVTVDTSLEAEVISAPRCSIGDQRRRGVASTAGDVVVHLDEDAVLTRADHIQTALHQLDEPAVSAVGGTVAPIRGNRLGQLSASLNPFRAWFPMHARAACPDGADCFPGGGRFFWNEDVQLKQHLRRRGCVVQNDDLVVLTDLPTRKQKIAMGAVAVAAGTLLGR